MKKIVILLFLFASHNAIAQNNQVLLDTISTELGYDLYYIENNKFVLLDSNKLQFSIFIKCCYENGEMYNSFKAKNILYLKSKEMADTNYLYFYDKILSLYYQTVKKKKKSNSSK